MIWHGDYLYSTGRDGTLRQYLLRESEGRFECLNADKLQMDWPATTNLSSSFGLLVLGFRSVSMFNRFHVRLLKLIDSFDFVNGSGGIMYPVAEFTTSN